ncbi:MAG TPA: putative sulfate exporter family transporter, partial [Candidatus Omnitrophota bacterium]|nr:putative sulfate exporter family transporter [Candidatus Omnitrophota bacterium]
TSIALLVITLIGLIVLVTYFLTGLGVRIPEESFAFFSATTLHQTGLVRLAASSVSPDCLSAALAVKAVRTAMIIPLVFCISFYMNIREHADFSVQMLVKNSFLKIPLFLWGFILTGVLFAYFPHSSVFEQSMKDFSAFLWTLAMTSLGMTVDVKQVASSFLRPFALGWIVWAVVVGNFCIAFFGLGI